MTENQSDSCNFLYLMITQKIIKIKAQVTTFGVLKSPKRRSSITHYHLITKNYKNYCFRKSMKSAEKLAQKPLPKPTL